MKEDCGGGQGLTKGCGAKGRSVDGRVILESILKEQYVDWIISSD
jgi:hypothetical protein